MRRSDHVRWSTRAGTGGISFGCQVLLAPDGTSRSESANGVRFLFTGREYLTPLGLYDYRHRAYSPTLGRFLQVDPLRFKPNDLNVYRYCFNEVIVCFDPWGLCSFKKRILFYYLYSGDPRIDQHPRDAVMIHTNRRYNERRWSIDQVVPSHGNVAHLVKDIEEARATDVVVLVHGSTTHEDIVYVESGDLKMFGISKQGLIGIVPAIRSPERIHHCNVKEGRIPVGVAIERAERQIDQILQSERANQER